MAAIALTASESKRDLCQNIKIYYRLQCPEQLSEFRQTLISEVEQQLVGKDSRH